VTVLRSILLFALAALAEIGGAWLVWQGVREHRGLAFVGAGILALGLYGFVATFQPESHFGRVLAAYGGVFVAGSLAWGMAVDGFRPDRYDLFGAALCPGFRSFGRAWSTDLRVDLRKGLIARADGVYLGVGVRPGQEVGAAGVSCQRRGGSGS
jgi:small multidrug resistance family-3 protein